MLWKKCAALATWVALLTAPIHAQNYDDGFEIEKQIAMLQSTPNGPADAPWLQYFGDTMVNTSAYRHDAPHTVCFSNPGTNDPWVAEGWATMQAEVDLHADIKEFIATDAEGSPEKQVLDIEDFLANGSCDVLIVLPADTYIVSPVVEEACKHLPVIVFHRVVDTACPVTFIKSIGSYGFGVQSAQFIAANAPAGGSVLMLRVRPWVDTLEMRYAAALFMLQSDGLNITDRAFTDGDPATTKSIIQDYVAKNGPPDAVWMDSATTSVAAIDAFVEMGLPVPVITAEDSQGFLERAQQLGLTAFIAPSNPVYQWRTPIIAALRVLDGETVPGPEWNLPQPAITAENIDAVVMPGMPRQHFVTCGCQDMPGYPEHWGAE